MVICVFVLLLLCLGVQALTCGSGTPRCGGSNSISPLCLFVESLGDSAPTLSDTGKYRTLKGNMSCDTRKYHTPKGKISCDTRKYCMPIGEISYNIGRVSHDLIKSITWSLKVSHNLLRNVIRN